MNKTLIASALLFSATLIPTGALANYYGYQRCMNGGGNWFSCLGELADTMVAGPELESQFGFAKGKGEDRIMESLKARSGTCDALKGDARMGCYEKGLKADLRAVAKPAVKLKSGTKAAVVNK